MDRPLLPESPAPASMAPSSAGTWRRLSERAFESEGFLNPAECEALIALAEREGFSPAGVRTAQGPASMPRVRNNERVVLSSPTWVATLWARLAQAGLPGLEGEVARGLPHELRFYKYTPGQRFKRHKDGPWHEDGLSSRLTFLVYLNDGFAGGATDFGAFLVQPRPGAALLFMHDTWHEGCEVTEGVKYVLRSDVLYGPAGGDPRT